MPTSLHPPRRVFVVGVCYHLAPCDFARRMERVARHSRVLFAGVVVANRRAHDETSLPSELILVEGSNADLDFSGYLEGLAHLLSNHDDAAHEPVLFVNDSLFTRHASRVVAGRIIALHALAAQLSVPAIAGKVDPYRWILSRNPWSGHTGYVSSFCFLLNAPALPVLRNLPADAARDGLAGDVSIDDPAWGMGLTPVMREYIRAHLSYTDSPYRWPSALNADSALLACKARCVYFEHRLSGAIGEAGAVVPINSGPRSQFGVALGELGARVIRMLFTTAAQ